MRGLKSGSQCARVIVDETLGGDQGANVGLPHKVVAKIKGMGRETQMGLPGLL